MGSGSLARSIPDKITLFPFTLLHFGGGSRGLCLLEDYDGDLLFMKEFPMIRAAVEKWYKGAAATPPGFVV